jgi:hypothetical protein
VGDDVGDKDDGSNDAGDNASKGDGRDAAGREGGGGGGSWQRTRLRRRQQQRQQRRWQLLIAGVLFAFYCEDIFVWYFYDVWGDQTRSHLPSHPCHA